jgi:hypothetical protein
MEAEAAAGGGDAMSERPKLTTAQRLVLLVAANGSVMVRDPLVPTGIYRSLVHPHGMLRTVRNGYVITTEGRAAIGQGFNDDMLEAAE